MRRQHEVDEALDDKGASTVAGVGSTHDKDHRLLVADFLLGAGGLGFGAAALIVVSLMVILVTAG